jgi:hypothetical protein
MDVERLAAERNSARLGQQIFDVHVAQVERVHLRRHASGIGVPVQQVERERFLAEQIIVHHERPDQIVGAQQVERARHL